MPASTQGVAASGRFYEAALDEAERAEFLLALQVEGIEEELALLRVRLRRALKDNPDDLALMLRGVDLLSRALARRYRLSRQDTAELVANLRGVLDGIRTKDEVREMTGG